MSQLSLQADPPRGRVAVAALALLGCTLSVAPVLLYIAARQSVRPLLHGDEPVWPFPGLVFLEILGGALIGLAAGLPGNRARLLWIGAGVLIATGALTFASTAFLVLLGGLLFAVAAIAKSKGYRFSLREGAATAATAAAASLLLIVATELILRA